MLSKLTEEEIDRVIDEKIIKEKIKKQKKIIEWLL